ncbi:tannase/feruloyl esterase family alpha/beta hydrolase [Jiella sp. 40Bstr34]|uniref:Tannase/feruloyl esterase family alpha/beta hydrolase n=2 Tax=Jiella pacifica TaxID=2696469 RepID=A0A6N9TCC5_9HYPH|nr:tannase/feruloyl esterase family alpha/beta hydrolase [Jiella pacifica]
MTTASATATAALAQNEPPESEAAASDRCEALGNFGMDGAYVTSTRVVAATDDLPAYCEVRATALPAISIEARLPLTNWNGKFYQTGCGGWCGILGRADASGRFVNAMGPGLARGYATATSDSGHHGLSVVDADWADANPNAERDWGWRAIGETYRVGRNLIAEFYGKPGGDSIFQGCSTGGRLAHMASLRYPENYQGIISGAPAMNETALAGPTLAWMVKANTDADGQTILKPGKEALIGDEVMRQCDELDGEKDGLISDPRLCKPDVSTLLCGTDSDAKQCLTKAEIGVVTKWYQAPVNSKGDKLFPGGIPAGSEPFWGLWLTGSEDGTAPLNPQFAKSFVAYLAFDRDPGPEWDPVDFDLDKDPARMSRAAEMFNSDSPDIAKFRAAGGKMIVWHGWADAIVLPFQTVDWFEKLKGAAGGAEELAKTVKLFMIPGMDHCGILPGPGGIAMETIDPLGALEQWMETGKAPDSIMRDK